MKKSISARPLVIPAQAIILGKRLGEGGFGIVYQGIWRKGPVAIKELLLSDKDFDEETEQALREELKIIVNLRGPNIVQVYGYCENPYRMVMEYMPKGSLYDVLRDRNESLPWDLRIRIAMDMSSGLAFLHSEDFLHRNIKSLNVLLSRDYGAKLSDFGLAKLRVKSQSTSTLKQSTGTLVWRAPELTTGEEGCTKATDVYSLGMTLCELAARDLSFKDVANPAFIPMKAAQDKRDTIPGDCPPKLTSLIEACCATEPEERPTAAETVEFMHSNVQEVRSFLRQYRGMAAVNSLASSGYQGYLNTGPSIAGLKQALPQVPARAAAPAPVVVAKPKPRAPSVNVQALSRFLVFVAHGEQAQAEAMLQRNRDLGLAPGSVTDLSKRTFKGITGFQYAVWALDWHMWKMLLKYLSEDEAWLQAEQLTKGPWVQAHGFDASPHLQDLMDALKTYIDHYDKWDAKKCEAHWCKQVGGAQLRVPVHVINEYCHPDRSFDPPPNFEDETELPRTRKGQIYANNEWKETDDVLTASSNCGSLGNNFGLARGARVAAEWEWGRGMGSWGGSADHRSITALYSTRTQQRDQLIVQLSDRSVVGPTRQRARK